MEAPPTTKRVKSDNGLLWRLVTDHPDICDMHVVPKLNGNDVKFFYDVNTESRRAIQRSDVQLRNAFKIGDFDSKSTISWALEKCPEKKERFCAQMALDGNLELLKFLHEKGCPWDEETCWCAAENGHLECFTRAKIFARKCVLGIEFGIMDSLRMKVLVLGLPKVVTSTV